MKVKLIALLLAALVLFTCGCSNSKEEEEVGEILSSDEINKLLFTANGSEITEEFFKYFVHYYKTEMESIYGEVADWNAELKDGMSYWEYVKHMAHEWFMFAASVRAQAVRLGLKITEEDETLLQQDWDKMCSNYGGEEAAIASLEESYCSKDMYRYILETNLYVEKCYEEMYGENGSKLSDEDCAEKTAEDGYLMAKHILVMTNGTDKDGNVIALTEDEKYEAYLQAESIIFQLDECEQEELNARFDELMFSYTDDPGIVSFPDGYLFQDGEMMEEFQNAVNGLEIGEYSDIVETSAGYHIILRLPINYDVIPTAYSGYLSSGYDYYTLRYIISEEMFQANLDAWSDRVEVVYEDAYETITMDELLARG